MAAPLPIAKQPKTQDEMRYQVQPGFQSRITIGGAAPDGRVLALDGTPTTLHASINASRPTILNFGSCT